MSKKSGKPSSSRGSTLARPSQPSASTSSSSKIAWSDDGTYYAHLSLAHDAHTVRIYAAASSGRCIARWASTTGEQVRALTWLVLPTASSSAAARGKKRRKANDEDTVEEAPATSTTAPQTALALGLDDGAVLLVHPTTSAIIARLEDPSGVSSPVSSLSCPSRPAKDGPPLLWAADDAGVVRAYALAASSGRLYGRAKGAGVGYGAALAVCYPSATMARLLVARFDIRSLDVTLESSGSLDLAQAIVGSAAAGHASEITSLASLDEAGAFASTAHGDRVVNFWRPNGDLAALTTLEDPPRSLSVRADALAATTETGAVAIVMVPTSLLAAEEAGAKKRKVVTVPVASRIGPGVRAARWADAQRLRIARGNELKPAFDLIEVRDSAGAFQSDIELGAVASAALLLDEDGDVNMGAPVARAQYKETNAAVASTLSANASDLPRRNEGELDVDMAGPTLAQRLKSLKIPAAPAAEADVVMLDGDDDEDGGALAGTRARRPANIPQATLAQTLVQALHSADSELIESCLSHTNVKLIRATVKRLPTSLVLPLVDHVVDRLARGKRGYGAAGPRGRALVVWLRTALVVHVGYLVTVPTLVNRLAHLHGTLHHRLEAHTPLLGLAGRLELVTSQIELRREAAGRPKVDAALQAMASGANAVARRDATTSRAAPPVRKYVEGASESSEADEESGEGDEEEDEWGGMEVDGAVEGEGEGEGEVEDVGFKFGGGGGDLDSEGSDDQGDDDSEDDAAPHTNGFLELEADVASDDDDEGSDADGDFAEGGASEGESDSDLADEGEADE